MRLVLVSVSILIYNFLKGFSKKRTQSRCCNKCVYFWEGCKKSCCLKSVTVTGFLDSFQVVKSSDKDIYNTKTDEELTHYENISMKEMIFKTTNSSEESNSRSSMNSNDSSNSLQTNCNYIN